MDKEIKKITIELKESGMDIDIEGLLPYEVIGIIEIYKNDILERLKEQKVKVVPMAKPE